MNRVIHTEAPETRLCALEKTLHLLIRIFVYSSAFYFFSFVTADTDLWGHLKFGKALYDAMAIQRVDIYSYTAFGSEWINHEWLSELVMHLVYSVLGSPGLLMGKLLVGFLIVYLLSRISFYRTFTPFVYGIVFVMCIFVMCPGFMIRPQVVTFLFAAYYMYCFHLYFEKGINLLWSLPIIMVFWVNCHGGFLVGVGMFPVVAGGEYIACRLRKRDTAHLRPMVFWLVLTEAAVFVNPYGYHLLGFLYETLRIPRGVTEWNPMTVFDLSYFRFKLLSVLFLSSLFVRNRERRYGEMGIIMIALIYALMHQRHAPVFAVVAAPYLTENISLMMQRVGLFDKIRSFSSYILLIVFLVLLISYQIAFAGYKYVKAEWNIIVDPTEYPVYATRFLKENGIKGKILVPFEWGEYAIWKLYPDCRVSIDGRFRTVYPEEVLKDHFEAAGDESRLKDLLEKYPADIILGRQNRLYQRLISSQKKWIYVYSDRTSIIFLKEEEFHGDVLKKFRKRQLIYPDKETKPLVYFP
ncbi:MAG: hypothetical protein JRL30_10290 [Deltaproteobacteria bacterium]|nr:hypothetical protein [Deltaproteobacteria bacterium]